MTSYAVLALISLTVGYLTGTRATGTSKADQKRDVTEEPSSSENNADLAAVKSSMMEDCKMVSQ